MDDNNKVVETRRLGRLAVVSIDNPPVNAVSHAVRAGLLAAFAGLAQHDDIDGVILTCKGRTFVAGADITEFNKPPRSPSLPEVIATIAEFPLPVIAAIHGTAFGGGLELALGCDHRIATGDAKMGLPEVRLGLVPGAGGTVRVPLLTGMEFALEMIVTGKSVDAPDALKAGLIDAIATDDLLSSAAEYFKDAYARNQGKRDLLAERDKLDRTDMVSFERHAEVLTKRDGDLLAPRACVRCLRNTLTRPLDEALSLERQIFNELKTGDQSKAIRHLFLAERAATKIEGVEKETLSIRIESCGIIGGGTMGTGIAMAFANAGIPALLLDVGTEQIARARGLIEKNYAMSVSRGSLTERQVEERTALISYTSDYAELAAKDLIIEAAFEDLDIKKAIFSKLDQLAHPDAILATNTSYLDVNLIAEATARPQQVVGAHFFSPANVMKLLEIVRGNQTRPEILKALIDLAKRIGKVPVVVGVCRGFVGNRMLAARGSESINLLLEGASPAQVDKVFTEFGWPMGPFQMQDLAGLDIGWRNRRSLGESLAVADDLCERGWFGQKSGRGYYRYEAGSRTPIPDLDVDGLIRSTAAKLGISNREIGPQEIIERTLYPMINDGYRILSEKIASRASDIDLVWVNGYGFPKSKGGPMFWAEQGRLREIAASLQQWHRKSGQRIYDPAPLLLKLAEAEVS